MSYSRSLYKEFKLPNGTRFTIRKINPLRIQGLDELRKAGPELSSEQIERMMNLTIKAGVVKPELIEEGLDLYIKGESEPLSYDDKLTLTIAINMHSGLDDESLERRRKFCQKQLGKSGSLNR